MRHTRPFQVHIEPPTGRWLIITFQTPTAPVQCGPSAILSDPIGDLVAALLVTAQSPAPVHFQWHEEPVLVDGAFHTTAQETRFTLIRSDQTAPPELLLAITAPRMVICAPSGARSVGSRVSSTRTHMPPRWAMPFRVLPCTSSPIGCRPTRRGITHDRTFHICPPAP